MRWIQIAPESFPDVYVREEEGSGYLVSMFGGDDEGGHHHSDAEILTLLQARLGEGRAFSFALGSSWDATNEAVAGEVVRRVVTS